MCRHRNAKVIATLGPASSTPEIVRSLFDAGADVFRLNFSHVTHEDHKKSATTGSGATHGSSRGPTGGRESARWPPAAAG
jgi:pyruvate kinase